MKYGRRILIILNLNVGYGIRTDTKYNVYEVRTYTKYTGYEVRTDTNILDME